MEKEIGELLNNILVDYTRGKQAWTDSMVRFAEGFEVKHGKKFIKIISGGSAWGFIVKEDGPKFKRGDILKAASWAAPAQNFARGNIITGGYKVVWMGA